MLNLPKRRIETEGNDVSGHTCPLVRMAAHTLACQHVGLSARQPADLLVCQPVGLPARRQTLIKNQRLLGWIPVSYTHLTLPTN